MNTLDELESVSRELDPTTKERKAIAAKLMDYAEDYLNELPELPGFNAGSFGQLATMQINGKGRPVNVILQALREADHSGINSASGRHLGFIPGGGLWITAFADFLSDITNKYSGIAFSGPGAVKIEAQVLQWMCGVVGYSAKAFGNLTSGGSVANLIAIKAARDFHKIDSTNVRKAVVYCSEQTHHSVYKALNITGIHECVLRKIGVTEQFRVDVNELKQRLKEDRAAGLKPFLIVASAGTTDTGAVDPLSEIADLCERFQTWFHVDAAYGGFFMMLDEMKQNFSGIERSDSVVLDPHKTLFLPFGSGAVLLRDGSRLLASNASKASYLADTEGADDISPADTGIELTRPNRGLRIWLPLQLHGVAPFKAALQEKLLLTRYFYEQIQKMGFETGPFPDLTVTIFRYPEEGNSINEKLIGAIHADGRVFLSSTKIGGQLWLRCAIVAHRTHLKEVQLTLEMIEELSKEVVAEGN